MGLFWKSVKLVKAEMYFDKGFNKVWVILTTIYVADISMLIEIILNVGRG